MVTVAVCNRLKPSIGLDTLFNAPMVLLNYVVQILADRMRARCDGVPISLSLATPDPRPRRRWTERVLRSANDGFLPIARLPDRSE